VNILLTHGSSNAEHDEAAAQLAAAVAAEAGEAFHIARLGESLPAGARVMPLFLTEGKHLREDVPAMLTAGKATLIAGPASHADAIAAMLADYVAEQRGRCRAVLLVLYRLLGSTALSAAIYRESKRFPLPAVAALHGECSFADVLALWRQDGHTDAFVQPVLLFPGASLDELAQRIGEHEMKVQLGKPLAELPGFVRWIAARFREGS